MTTYDDLTSRKGRLKYLREQAGLSQRQLAALSGVKPSTISLIESGGRKGIGNNIGEKLVITLGTTLDWLLSCRGEMPSLSAIKAAVEAAREKQPPMPNRRTVKRVAA